MSRSVSLLLATMATAFLGVGCRKSEQSEPPPATGTEQKVEAPAAAPEVKEIRIGQLMPYSGPAAAYGTIGKVHAAYFKKLNREGGINGYQVNLISLDDMYSPPKAVEQTRKLVEQEKVVAVFNSVGTPSNSAVQKYLNQKEIPQLFVATGASKWADPQNYPWTIGFNPSYHVEGKQFAEAILKLNPKAKVAVLYQNDDFGKDILGGLKEGFGDKADKIIVAQATYEVTDPTTDSQVLTLKGSKADFFVNISTPKFAAQTIRKVADSGWKVKHFVANVGASVGGVLVPAGLDKAKGLYTMGYFKEVTNPLWDNDPAMVKWREFMKAEYPEGNVKDGANAYGYLTAEVLVEVLKKCGTDFSPKNIMAQATSLKDYSHGLMDPGLKITTSPTDYQTFDKLALAQFDGKTWQPITE
jgi:branched-chain amino acid transport system substrate-binding protein